MLETLPGESITVARHFSCHWTVYPEKKRVAVNKILE